VLLALIARGASSQPMMASGVHRSSLPGKRTPRSAFLHGRRRVLQRQIAHVARSAVAIPQAAR
jgi:hypothetical protein